MSLRINTGISNNHVINLDSCIRSKTRFTGMTTRCIHSKTRYAGMTNLKIYSSE